MWKKWNVVDLRGEEEFLAKEPFYEIEKLLRWRKIKRGRQMKKEDLVLWKDYPIEEAQWVPAKNIMKPSELQKYIKEDNPPEERV